MKYKHVIGIDISKGMIDMCLLKQDWSLSYEKTTNQANDIYYELKGLCEANGVSLNETLLCAEYTGHYGKQLIEVALNKRLNLWMESPAQIKRSQGVQRGKDDKKDAERIAVYARRFMDRAVLMKTEDPVYDKLAYLCSERDLLVVDRAKYMAQLKDQKGFSPQKLYQQKKKRYEKLIKALDKAILEIEGQIDQLIERDPSLNRQFEIVTSVDGIGKQVAVQTIVATKGFTKFKGARKFICHVGCAPFSYHSGSSIHSKNKVSHRANKKLKQLYHMASLSVIRMEGTMRDYYERKVQEGKNKMSVINAIRGKLITIIFALIKSNRKYEKNYIPCFD